MPEVVTRTAKSLLPATAALELTHRCNHFCLFCSCPWEAPTREGRSFFAAISSDSKSESSAVDETGELLTGAQWQEIIDYLTVEHEVCRFALTGGEPTLRQDFPEILKYLFTRRVLWVESTGPGEIHTELRPPEITVITNGRALNKKLIKLLADCGANISISLPGLAEYARHTGVDNSRAAEALGWIRYCSAAGLNVTANITVTALNLNELSQTIGNAICAGAGFILLNRFLPGGRGIKNQELLELSSNQVRQAIIKAEAVLAEAGVYGSLGTEVPLCLIRGIDTRWLTVGTRCAGGREFFAVDPSGGVRPCNHSPASLGSWRELPKILRGDYWGKFLFRRFLPAACQSCDLKYNCDGGCREAAHICGGQLNSPDPVLPVAE